MSKLDLQLRNLVNDYNQGDRAGDLVAEQTRSWRRDTPDATPKVGVFVKYNGDISTIEALDFETATNLGTIATGFVPIDKIDDLAALSIVTRIEISRPLYPELDVSMLEIQANSVHTGSPAFRGTGVVVGIIDTGIDYRHLSFRNPDGTSRILAIWDQSSGLAGSPPSGFPLGVEYTKAQLDAALASATPLATVPHEDTNGHGTHVAGSAAGNGLAAGNCRGASTFVGVAPQADLIFVKNSSETEALGESLNLIMAVDYIFAKAASLSNPAVINLSQGDNIGPHDGTSWVEQSLDILLAQPGRAMIKSAGNEGSRNRHASGTIANGATEQVGFRVPQGQTGTVIRHGDRAARHHARRANQQRCWGNRRDCDPTECSSRVVSRIVICGRFGVRRAVAGSVTRFHVDRVSRKPPTHGGRSVDDARRARTRTRNRRARRSYTASVHAQAAAFGAHRRLAAKSCAGAANHV